MPSRSRMDNIPYRGGPLPGPHYGRDLGYDERPHPPHGYDSHRRRTSMDEPHGHHRARDPYGQPSRRDSGHSGVPFETALANLLGTLEFARNFFATFDRNFMDEIRGIKTYASPEILDNLWSNKIRASQRPPRNRRPRQSNDSGYQEDPRENIEDAAGNFSEIMIELTDNFMAAFQSKRKSYSRRDRPLPSGSDSIGRLLEKLHTHYGFLEKIIHNLSRKRDDQEMRDFMLELDQACDILKKSRNSWDPREGNADRDDGGGGYGDGLGSDGGGGGGGGGGDGYQDGMN